MAQALAQCPVPIATLTPHVPTYIGATDASKEGMGGFWLPAILTPDTQPCIWRTAFPSDITNHLVSQDNKAGTINNSKLKLAAVITGQATLLQHTKYLHYQHILLGTDNTPTHSWITSGSVTTSKPPVFLLRLLATTCQNWNASLSTVTVPGSTNRLAD